MTQASASGRGGAAPKEPASEKRRLGGRRNTEGRMSLGQHLIELRNRILISAGAIFLATIGGFFLYPPVWQALERPLLEAGAEGQAVISYVAINEPFDIIMRVALTLGLVISSPVWFYQLWAYIMPALLRTERRYAVGFMLASIPLFLAGCFMGWIVFPRIIDLMTSFVPDGAEANFTATFYLDYFLKLTLAVGIGFVFPVVLVLLNFLGIVSGRAILKQWRVAIIVVAIFAALATPSTDVVSMLLLTAPLVGLYLAAGVVGIFRDRLVARRTARILEDGVPTPDRTT
ncbi:twin-arginine translocase subunit TatC [Arenivirga flava]|uniref:Sec-independent protein translocase protein TatC n=1 Tax=Arenivirga flava TaxID=1930060 RepID=A0AA37UHV8_9MICO|nr:twin-arginine translocase subunit TatC [Arenivirga flava]GMA27477.1 Sec-independent protein translocase protein TatC [Arenivirga flava]